MQFACVIPFVDTPQVRQDLRGEFNVQATYQRQHFAGGAG